MLVYPKQVLTELERFKNPKKRIHRTSIVSAAFELGGLDPDERTQIRRGRHRIGLSLDQAELREDA